MSNFEIEYPGIRSENVLNARLFANRFDMFRGLAGHREKVAEVGVALGDGSKVLIESFTPKEFVAFDLFDLHTVPTFWGRSNTEWFGEKDHEAYFVDKVSPMVDTLVAKRGDSSTELSKFPEDYFDMIYIDGDHSYEGAKKDSDAARKVIKDDGLLIFNDYVLIDTFSREKYGVVPVVNDLIENHGWKVVGFALQEAMFCDIALAKVQPKSKRWWWPFSS